jgi:conjugative relaxase-like TrwC/TraI family protein
MLSQSSISSSSGAASYFGKDDYYASGGATEGSTWGGQIAEQQGLKGAVNEADFKNMLEGKLPDGTLVNQTEKRQIGTDLTFSMPKSASIVGLVGGDTRVLQAHLDVVKETMSQVERIFAEARSYERTKNGEPVGTSKMIYAMFEHMTSREQDPQAHIHAVFANITQRADGKYVALRNSAIYKNNTVIGSMYHAAFRDKLEKLGYKTEITGKHGQFEIAGVDKSLIGIFSQRREQILEKIKALGMKSPEGRDAVTLGTRAAKKQSVDKDALFQGWREKAASLGYTPQMIIDKAMEHGGKSKDDNAQWFSGLSDKLKSFVETMTSPNDPMVGTLKERLTISPDELRSRMAVASSIRMLSEREAAFSKHAIAANAMNLGLKGVTFTKAEARIDTLLAKGALVPEMSARIDGKQMMVTTKEQIKIERSVINGINDGKDRGLVILSPHQAEEHLKGTLDGRNLNDGQMGAGKLILSSNDRIVAVQGKAGAGKSTLIKAVASVATAQGKEVWGVAHQGKLVDDMKHETGINAQTVSSFINAHIKGALAGQGKLFDKSLEMLSNTIVILDEASMIGNKAMQNLIIIANSYKLDKLVLMGDFKQLTAIEAGKAFVLALAGGIQTAFLDANLRQKTEQLRNIAEHSRQGNIKAAFDGLGDNVKEFGMGKNIGEIAAGSWLARSPQEREKTVLLTASKHVREEMNSFIQTALKQEGAIGHKAYERITYQRHGVTNEELRYAQTYEKGKFVILDRTSGALGLKEGNYQVLGTNKNGLVSLERGGKRYILDPSKIPANAKQDPVKLYDQSKINLHEGDKIRWGANDKERGIFNAAQAKILKIADGKILFDLGKDKQIELKLDDKLLDKIGLAYAINTHMAQGITADKAISVMLPEESKLTTERNLYVIITRVREEVQIFTSSIAQLIKRIEGNEGNKTSALETINELKIDPPKSVGAELTRNWSATSKTHSSPKMADIKADSLQRQDTAQPSLKQPQKQLNLEL